MPIGSAGVSNYANVTSGTASGVSADDAGDVSGAGVTVLYSGAGNFLLLESGDYLLQETGTYPNNRFLLEVQ
jgi:hypothetical protein